MRYFFEVSYKGTKYAGFQVQANANTIQAEVEKALRIFFKKDIPLTGSSRTDAGVHALQNFFHGDSDGPLDLSSSYNLNAILPPDIVIRKIVPVSDQAHCRFDAISREYHYFIYNKKDPFMLDRAYFYPYNLQIELLHQSANIIVSNNNFLQFSKRNTQVNNHICTVSKSEWVAETGCLVYKVKANRFLRGMVRALVATMLKVGTNKISIEDFEKNFTNESASSVEFAAPPQGLFLAEVIYKF